MEEMGEALIDYGDREWCAEVSGEVVAWKRWVRR